MTPSQNDQKAAAKEIEAAYREHPFIREIGVLEDAGEAVGVIVPDLEGLEQGSETRVGEAIRQAVRLRNQKLSQDRRISEYLISPAPLARTKDDTIDRDRLRERYERLRAGRSPRNRRQKPMSPDAMAPEDRRLLETDETVRKLWEWLKDRFPDKPLAPGSNFQLDLEVDSLTWIDMILELGDELEIYLPEERVGRIRTVRDLLRFVHEEETNKHARHASPLDNPEAVLTPDRQQWLEPPGWPTSVLAGLMYGTNGLVMKLAFQRQFKNRHHLPNEEPFVLVPNHCSYLDPLAIYGLLSFKRQKRTHWFAWERMVRLNVLTYLAHRAERALPVDPVNGVLSSLAQTAAALKRQRNLVWFPEGRRSPDGTLQPFQPGLGRLLNTFDVPVVPVYIEGTFEAWPAGQRFPRPNPITVTVDEPVRSRRLRESGGQKDSTRHTMEALRDRMLELEQRIHA